MKYNFRIIGALVLLFLAAQIIGLSLIFGQLDVTIDSQTGFPVATHTEPVIGPRPEIQGIESLLYLLSGVLLGTGLIFVLIRFQKINVWRMFFFVAVFIAMSVALGVVFAPEIAFGTAFLLALLKTFRHHIIIHNITELLIYAGLAIIFVPLFKPFWAVMLLFAISAYDAFAVWKSKHMITLAKFQTSSKAFAGLFISFGKQDKTNRSRKQRSGNRAATPASYQQPSGEAILGGGDIAFPLLFAGSVMTWLINTVHISKGLAFLHVLAIPLVTAIVLLLLLLKGQTGRYYPAMPFLTIGCLAGFGAILLAL